MARYLLDTNHLSPLVSAGHPLRQRVRQALRDQHQFAIAAPVLAEFLYGISLLPRANHNLAEWSRIKADFEYYSIEIVDAEMAASLRTSLRKRGWQLGLTDALIAAVALRNDLIVLTTDGDFRQVPELKRENWLA
jgi:tRNA(fMet)-specific endonuclease VapC